MSEPIRYTQAIKCVEPSYHAQDICSGMVECSIGEWVLHSDYARLKAEVEKLTFDPMSYLDDHGEWMPRYTHLVAVERLKAEVERLQSIHSIDSIGIEQLKAEVERLTELNATISLRYDATKSMLDGCAKEIEEMEAEVERLTSDLQMEKENEDRLVRLHQDARNEVERLTKAGDEMVTFFPETGRIANAWHAAKHAAKGVQS